MKFLPTTLLLGATISLAVIMMIPISSVYAETLNIN
jgi:hypothetical protein